MRNESSSCEVTVVTATGGLAQLCLLPGSVLSCGGAPGASRPVWVPHDMRNPTFQRTKGGPPTKGRARNGAPQTGELRSPGQPGAAVPT